MIIKFGDIGESFPVPSKIRGKYQRYYSDIYDFVIHNYRDRISFKLFIVELLNTVLYFLITDGEVPYDWEDNFNNYDINQSPDKLCIIDSDELRRTLKQLYLDVDDIDWNVQRVTPILDIKNEDTRHLSDSSGNHGYTYNSKKLIASTSLEDTPKEDLFITIPEYPRVGEFDKQFNKIRISLPKIPTKQREISCTTDVNVMSDRDLLNLFPNNFIRTRSEVMYRPRDGITMDPDYGLLIPVDGFTDAQVRDNIIRYPHIFRLKREVDGVSENFYNKIELDGDLFSILDVWKYLPEARIIAIDDMDSRSDQIEFIKEYAIRRYLLERDIKGIEHKYPISGCLDEFITLFMPKDKYRLEGYKDLVDLARTSVKSRVSYLISRNPRIDKSVTVEDCVFGAYCTNPVCDRSCPRWTQLSYLMGRNNVSPEDDVFHMTNESLNRYKDIYSECEGRFTVFTMDKDEILTSDVFTYIGLCKLWNGSALRCDVYHLKFSKYLDMVQDSWTQKSDNLGYIDIWIQEAKLLVISDIDYVNFKDFQSQKLLRIIQDRERQKGTTLLISPRIENLAGQGKMFSLLLSKLRQHSRMLG